MIFSFDYNIIMINCSRSKRENVPVKQGLVKILNYEMYYYLNKQPFVVIASFYVMQASITTLLHAHINSLSIYFQFRGNTKCYHFILYFRLFIIFQSN